MQIVWNIAVELLYFVVLVFLVGYLIYLLNRAFYRLTGGRRAVVYLTGLVGVPVHELSHAALCLLFGHKIVRIRFFQLDDGSGTLGYVAHTYNRRNLYQSMGNYFIGVAPVVVGALIIYLATRLLLPEAFGTIHGLLTAFAGENAGGLSFSVLLEALRALGLMVAAVFGAIGVGLRWWVFMLIVFCIALHMNLSGADIRGSLTGLPFVVLLIVLLNIVLGFFGGVYTSFTSFMNVAGGYLAGTLLLSLVFSLVLALVAAIVRALIRLIARR